MNRSAIEALRHSLIAAQFCTDPELRGLALSRFDTVEDQIATLPDAQQNELHASLLRMLPSDWPLWVESARALSGDRAH